MESCIFPAEIILHITSLTDVDGRIPFYYLCREIRSLTRRQYIEDKAFLLHSTCDRMKDIIKYYDDYEEFKEILAYHISNQEIYRILIHLIRMQKNNIIKNMIKECKYEFNCLESYMIKTLLHICIRYDNRRLFLFLLRGKYNITYRSFYFFNLACFYDAREITHFYLELQSCLLNEDEAYHNRFMGMGFYDFMELKTGERFSSIKLKSYLIKDYSLAIFLASARNNKYTVLNLLNFVKMMKEKYNSSYFTFDPTKTHITYYSSENKSDEFVTYICLNNKSRYKFYRSKRTDRFLESSKIKLDDKSNILSNISTWFSVKDGSKTCEERSIENEVVNHFISYLENEMIYCSIEDNDTMISNLSRLCNRKILDNLIHYYIIEFGHLKLDSENIYNIIDSVSFNFYASICVLDKIKEIISDFEYPSGSINDYILRFILSAGTIRNYSLLKYLLLEYSNFIDRSRLRINLKSIKSSLKELFRNTYDYHTHQSIKRIIKLINTYIKI